MYICIHIGFFPSCTGTSITDLSYNEASLNLICTSTGRPIDSVTWLKDGKEISNSNSGFHQWQLITDRVTATYQYILFSENDTNFEGNFSCFVRDGSGGTATRSLTLNGLFVDNKEMLPTRAPCVSE